MCRCALLIDRDVECSIGTENALMVLGAVSRITITSQDCFDVQPALAPLPASDSCLAQAKQSPLRFS